MKLLSCPKCDVWLMLCSNCNGLGMNIVRGKRKKCPKCNGHGLTMDKSKAKEAH